MSSVGRGKSPGDMSESNSQSPSNLRPHSRTSRSSSTKLGPKTMNLNPQASSPIRSISPERREWVRKESETLFARNMIVREKTKERMYEQRLQHERMLQASHTMRLSKWMGKTKNSPFAVNLVAEDERISEENQIRSREEEERRKMIETRKERAKNEIVLKALSEFSDLEALRKEKRAIMEEEQRLRALLALEKVTVNNKADRLVAERAQRQRHEAKLEHRRRVYRDSLDQIMEEERTALMKKHALLNPATKLMMSSHNSQQQLRGSLSSQQAQDWTL